MKNIKKLLWQQCKSQRDLARETGLSKSMVSAVITQARRPGAATRLKIATALQVAPADLFRFPGGKR